MSTFVKYKGKIGLLVLNPVSKETAQKLFKAFDSDGILNKIQNDVGVIDVGGSKLIVPTDEIKIENKDNLLTPFNVGFLLGNLVRNSELSIEELNKFLIKDQEFIAGLSEGLVIPNEILVGEEVGEIQKELPSTMYVSDGKTLRSLPGDVTVKFDGYNGYCWAFVKDGITHLYKITRHRSFKIKDDVSISLPVFEINEVDDKDLFNNPKVESIIKSLELTNNVIFENRQVVESLENIDLENLKGEVNLILSLMLPGRVVHLILEGFFNKILDSFNEGDFVNSNYGEAKILEYSGNKVVIQLFDEDSTVLKVDIDEIYPFEVKKVMKEQLSPFWYKKIDIEWALQIVANKSPFIKLPILNMAVQKFKNKGLEKISPNELYNLYIKME